MVKFTVRHPLAVALLACGFPVLASGCNPVSMAGKGFRELKGASAKVLVIQGASADFHQNISAVQMGTVTNAISPVCDAQTFGEIKQALSERSGEASEKMEGDGTSCTVDVEVQFYQDSGGLGSLLGKQSLLIGRARVSAASSSDAADLLVIATSKAMRTGASALAEAFAEVLMDYCREGRTED